LLAAARAEFAARGLEGARVDEIARRAGVNKQLVYHYFGAKDDLYRHVMESVYLGIRESERSLDLTSSPPDVAMRRLIDFSFAYLDENRAFVSLLADENVHEGRHLAQIENLSRMHSPLIEVIRDALQRGRDQDIFRDDVDPRQLYISIAGLSFFYFSNVHTLSAIFGENLDRPSAIAARRAHIVDFVMAALRA